MRIPTQYTEAEVLILFLFEYETRQHPFLLGFKMIITRAITLPGVTNYSVPRNICALYETSKPSLIRLLRNIMETAIS